MGRGPGGKGLQPINPSSKTLKGKEGTRTFAGRVLHLQAAEPLLDSVGTKPGGGAGGKTVTAGPSVSYPDCLVGCSGTSRASYVSCIVCTGTRVPSEDSWACGRVGGCMEGRVPPIVQAELAQWLCPSLHQLEGWKAEAASVPSHIGWKKKSQSMYLASH